MISKQTIARIFPFVLTIMILAAALFFPVPGHAKAEIVPIEGVDFNVGLSMNENLKTLIGKKINVTLSSGQTFYGTLVKVGDHLIHLEKLNRKEFFDGLIRIESISAIDVMFRSYKQ